MFECKLSVGVTLIHILSAKNAGLIYSEYSNQILLLFLKWEL